MRLRSDLVAPGALALVAACAGDPTPPSSDSILAVWEGEPVAGSTQTLVFEGEEASGRWDLDQITAVPSIGPGCRARSISNGTFTRDVDGDAIELVPAEGTGGIEGCIDASRDVAATPLTSAQLEAGHLEGSYALARSTLTIVTTVAGVGEVTLSFERVE